jgi:hypothetical protein
LLLLIPLLAAGWTSEPAGLRVDGGQEIEGDSRSGGWLRNRTPPQKRLDLQPCTGSPARPYSSRPIQPRLLRPPYTTAAPTPSRPYRCSMLGRVRLSFNSGRPATECTQGHIESRLDAWYL